jgi:hypothetical protein
MIKKFIYKTFFFISVFILFHLVFAIFFAGGKTDAFYLRFTANKESSLILGSSRAAQGIIPSIINNKLKINGIQKNLYNFSFTVSHSPFGPVYYNAIKKKLNHQNKNAVFIIEVNPWSISKEKTNNNDDCSLFREQDLCLANTTSFNITPNLEYLVKNYGRGWGNLLISKYSDSYFILNSDGWLEVTIDLDVNNLDEKIKEKTKEYIEKAKAYNLSLKRIQYLIKTIEMLESHGDILLVRLPVSNQIYDVEKEYFLKFDILISNIAQKYNIQYLTLQEHENKIITTDGNHLYKESGRFISEKIADFILTGFNK